MNLMKKFAVTGVCLAALAFIGCGDSTDLIAPAPAQAQAAGFRTFAASGATDVPTRIAEFQTFLGGADNGNTSGTQATGFRSVNWDAGIVPVHPAAFPSDFFNNIANFPPTRGLVVGTGPGNGLVAFDMSVPASSPSNINANYADEFAAFSDFKTFSPSGTNILWARFEVPNGTGVPAGHTGFGVVFSDVDTAGSTTVEFFNGNTSLGTFEAPVRSDANGHSFLGVAWDNGQRVTSVRLDLGTAALGAAVDDVSDGGTNDLVIVDDFFYGEPRVAGS